VVLASATTDLAKSHLAVCLQTAIFDQIFQVYEPRIRINGQSLWGKARQAVFVDMHEWIY
jgi:hypothetical protein